MRPLRIALYSHDTVGLGHFRRNLMLARSFVALEPRPHVLMISGATEAVRFPKPPGVDVITLPALTKVERNRYGSRSLGVRLEELVDLRARTILAAVSSFAPDLLVVDNVPRGAQGELDATLERLRADGRTHVVLGLRDVLDEPEAVRREWRGLGNEEVIERLFDAVWVYGDRQVVDLAREYGFGRPTASRIHYVGYLDRCEDATRGPSSAEADGTAARVAGGRPYALCLVGGGEDGVRLAEAFSRLEARPDQDRVLLLGPYMPEAARLAVRARAEASPDLEVIDFLEDPMPLVAGASSVISMGGHNSVSEILSFDRPALIVPRVSPRREQWVRAHRLARLGLVDVLDPAELEPERLAGWLEKTPTRSFRAREAVDMGGLERTRALVAELALARAFEREEVGA
ncbi:MAG: glycosyltransferase [Spirochaetaceae bacterium]|nr:hypothetical protein [Myxococcales bacterium]MCB9723600.1 glycosyltransferase [Spirochaetaceae bacterium]HPG26825.1 glycosyltransferase [Myxococcota bacterium]